MMEKQKMSENKSVKGGELIGYIKTLIKKGNVRRLIIKKPSGKKMLEVPLSAGIGVVGVLTIFAPVLVAISAVAALVAEFKVEIIHADDE
ncbi:MAG: hypothetical protein DSZ28_04555 [Thiothrix sp.]|nr:MAG: hypothetical protein DSZ28_04555 [Thiothrix sp.]